MGSDLIFNVFLGQCDQAKDSALSRDDKDMKDYCQQHGFDAWFETSAKENINIEEAARFLIARVSIVWIFQVHYLSNLFFKLSSNIFFNTQQNVQFIVYEKLLIGDI